MSATETFDHSTTRDLWDRAAEYRKHQPVVRIGPNVVYIARYHDARKIFRNPQVFSNQGGFKADGVVIPLVDSSPSDYDDPEHAPIRRLAMECAGPTHLENQRTFAHMAAGELVAALDADGSGTAELVAELALPLVGRVTVNLLGAPDADASAVVDWADEIVNSGFFTYLRTERGSGYHGAFPEFSNYLDALIAERKIHPEIDDGVGRIVRAIDAGIEGFTAEQANDLAFMMVKEMVVAAMGTTRDYTAWICYEMAKSPEIYEQIYNNRDEFTVPALEEILRLYPPILYEMRKCMAETEMHGVAIHPGDRVLVGLASANRDEEVFEDADTLRLDRPSRPAHIAFGHGMHMCVGNALARIEGHAVLSALLDRFRPGTMSLAPGFELQLTPLAFLYGAERVDVVFDHHR